VLGMCPMLAVTNSAVNALAMGGATFFVLVASSFLVSSLKQWIPKQVRISTYVIIIATFVTAADYSLEALLPEVHKQLGAFIPLIVVNCMILGRQEAFASRNSVPLAVLDAIGMASGFLFALFALGSVREILGDGSFFGIDLFGPDFEPWVIMVLPPGGFLTLGLLLLFFSWVKERKEQLAERLAEAGGELS
jgi:Na+-translocating ferredoxin:NAD+ oxidoreductase subunit E